MGAGLIKDDLSSHRGREAIGPPRHMGRLTGFSGITMEQTTETMNLALKTI